MTSKSSRSPSTTVNGSRATCSSFRPRPTARTCATVRRRAALNRSHPYTLYGCSGSGSVTPDPEKESGGGLPPVRSKCRRKVRSSTSGASSFEICVCKIGYEHLRGFKSTHTHQRDLGIFCWSIATRLELLEGRERSRDVFQESLQYSYYKHPCSGMLTSNDATIGACDALYVLQRGVKTIIRSPCLVWLFM